MQNSKNGQPSQMFSFLSTIIVVGLFAVIGLSVVMSITSTGEEIDYIRFRNTLLDSIDSVASDYNAKQEIDLIVPKGIQSICFINLMNNPPTDQESSDELDPVIMNYWSDEDYRIQYVSSIKENNALPRNVFLVGDGVVGSFHIDDLITDEAGDDFYCIESARSRIKFNVETSGRKVMVKP